VSARLARLHALYRAARKARPVREFLTLEKPRGAFFPEPSAVYLHFHVVPPIGRFFILVPLSQKSAQKVSKLAELCQDFS